MHELKKDPDTKNIKVVFLTNLGDARPDAVSADEKAAQDVGALGYLRKTDDLDNLLDRVKAYLER